MRNFCISYNTIEMADRSADKQIFPAKFEADLKTILSGDATVVAAFQAALKADDAKESVNALPAKIDVKSVKLLTDFLENNEQVEVIKKLEAKLNNQSKDIDALKDSLQKKKADLSA